MEILIEVIGIREILVMEMVHSKLHQYQFFYSCPFEYPKAMMITFDSFIMIIIINFIMVNMIDVTNFFYFLKRFKKKDSNQKKFLNLNSLIYSIHYIFILLILELLLSTRFITHLLYL